MSCGFPRLHSLALAAPSGYSAAVMLGSGVLAFLYFDSPGYLALLAVVPLIVALSFRSLAGLGTARRLLGRGAGDQVLRASSAFVTSLKTSSAKNAVTPTPTKTYHR